jgi:hypothetical protein
MKTVSITFLLLIITCTNCKKDPDIIIKGFFDSMHFSRQGGGQIEFYLYPMDSPDKLRADIIKYNFHDTQLQVIIDINENPNVFSLLNQAMNNQVQINGDFRQPTTDTGTWAFIYLVSDNKETEVTNIELRNTLLKFEQLVEAKIQ